MQWESGPCFIKKNPGVQFVAGLQFVEAIVEMVCLQNCKCPVGLKAVLGNWVRPKLGDMVTKIGRYLDRLKMMEKKHIN